MKPRALTLIALAAASACCLVDCGGAQKPPCTPDTLARIEGAYTARVIAACHGVTFDECPDVPALKNVRAQEEKDAECR